MSKKHKKNINEDQIKTVAVVSLGCSKNLVDTEIMLAALGSAGCAIGAEPEEADVILVNTCAFIRDAVEESGRAIRDAAAIRRRGPCRKLIVAGCLPQRERGKLLRKYPEIDLIIGTESYPDIAVLLKSNAKEGFAPCGPAAGARPRFVTTPYWTAWLKIAEGCSNRCSYCLIPSLRGAYRSFPADDIAAEAARLVEAGARELILVAQDTTRYGADIGAGASLPGLLRKLSGIENVRWLRVMYAYPELVSDELVRTMAETPRVCKYLDMPIQHIDGDILKAMNRRGGPEAIRGAIKSLRDAMPDMALRTTVLVGFPGETKEKFRALLDFIGETRFDRLGAFAYSPEEGTAAAAMPGQVPEDAKKERLAAVMELQKKISLEKNQSLIGKTFEALVEDVAKEDGEVFSVGRTYRDAPDIDGLFFIDREEEPGSFVEAKVTAVGEYDLRGE